MAFRLKLFRNFIYLQYDCWLYQSRNFWFTINKRWSSPKRLYYLAFYASPCIWYDFKAFLKMCSVREIPSQRLVFIEATRCGVQRDCELRLTYEDGIFIMLRNSSHVNKILPWGNTKTSKRCQLNIYFLYCLFRHIENI